MDPILAEAILRTLRVLVVVTGSLVLIDSIGILMRPVEHPPHKPKWSAISWCVVAVTGAGVAGYLTVTSSPPTAMLNPYIYGGLTIGFTLRAVSRAHRPLYTVLAVIGLSIVGIIFALKDIAG